MHFLSIPFSLANSIGWDNREGAQLWTVLIMVWLSFGLALALDWSRFGSCVLILFSARVMSIWLWIAFGLVLESDLVLAPIWIWIGEGSPLL